MKPLNHLLAGKIYGATGGLHGLLNGCFVDLHHLSTEERYRLRWTPGAALGSWRYKLTLSDIEKNCGDIKEKKISAISSLLVEMDQ
ncbi:hypothetical protein GCM10020331_096180 [Ectobacillus funiculus]